MKPLILLDIDGVLNPVARSVRGSDRPELILSDARVALVRRLAGCGRIAWVSTWPADFTAGLELRSVTRWLARMEAAGAELRD